MTYNELVLVLLALKRARDALVNIPVRQGNHNSDINRALKFVNEAIETMLQAQRTVTDKNK